MPAAKPGVTMKRAFHYSQLELLRLHVTGATVTSQLRGTIQTKKLRSGWIRKTGKIGRHSFWDPSIRSGCSPRRSASVRRKISKAPQGEREREINERGNSKKPEDKGVFYSPGKYTV